MSPPSALTRFTSRLLARFARPSVFVVFLEFTPAHRASGWEILTRFIDRVFPGHRVRFVVVDNAFERDEDVPGQEGADVIAGDNSSREFSGFDRGIEFVRRRHAPPPDSVFVLANDTFHRSYGMEYLESFRAGPVRSALRSGSAVGYVDCYPTEIHVLGLPVRCWIRTSLVLLGSRTLDAVGTLALPVENERIFGSADQFFRVDAPLSESYQKYLRAWLFGEDGHEFNERWHSMQPLTAESFADFQGKARSILCEHYLSARLRARGIEIRRVN